jgi:transposase
MPSSVWATAEKKTLRASEQERADVKQQREQWQQDQPQWDASHLVFLDEAGAKTNMTRLRARVKGGARACDATPSGHWSTTTMLSALRADGQTACMVVAGATDRAVFREYVRNVLAPTLQVGDVIILDNLAAHKDVPARELIEARGARLLFLPAYSPDLNPIEKMWSKVKEWLRAAKARSEQLLVEQIGKALEQVTPDDARGWFQSCGYVIQ